MKRVDAVHTETFIDIFGEIGLLNCDSVMTELKPDAKPLVTATPCWIPFPHIPKVEAELKHMLALATTETDQTTLNDILVFCLSVEEQDQRLKAVLRAIDSPA